MPKAIVAYSRVEPRPETSDAPWWQSRAFVLALGIGSSFAGALAYAGPSATMAALTFLTDGPIALAWLAAAAGAGAAALVLCAPAGSASTPSDDATGNERSGALLRTVTAVALGLGLLGLLVLGLGLAGWLNRATAFALLVGGVLAGAGAAGLSSRRHAARRPSVVAASALAWWRGRATWHGWAWLAVVPFASVALVGTTVPPGLLWTPEEPHGYDVVEYHLQVPREWYEARRITPLRHNAFSYFPMGVEAHYLLAMHLDGGPWDGMYLAQLMHLSFVVLAVLAACAFANQLAPNRAAATIAGVALATVPCLAQLGAIAYNEGGFLLYGTLAIGWALRATLDPRGRTRRFLLGGAMAGLACGTKLTAAPELLVAVPVVAWAVLLAARLRGAAVRPADWLAPAAFVLAGLLMFAPWLARNAAWAGNPVFPEAMPLLGRAHFGADQVERWSRAHSAHPGETSAGERLRAAWRQIGANWQFGYVLLPLAVVALVGARRQPAAAFLAGLLLLLAAFWLGFTHLQGRFFVLALPIGALLLAHAPWPRWVPIGLAIVCAAAVPGWLQLHHRLTARLYDGPDPAGWLVTHHVLGNSNIGWLTPEALDALPPGAAVTLVGDAKAFWYPIPMARLRYRTVFDADTSGGVLAAWVAPASGDAPGERPWLLVDPAELRRFAQTYPPFPTVPRALDRGNRPFLMAPDEPLPAE